MASPGVVACSILARFGLAVVAVIVTAFASGATTWAEFVDAESKVQLVVVGMGGFIYFIWRLGFGKFIMFTALKFCFNSPCFSLDFEVI